MQMQKETGTAMARAVREKVHRAARTITGRGRGDALDRLVEAWHYLRPLFPNAVPGQAGLTDAQKLELQGILASMGGRRGAGANGPQIRRLDRWEVVKVADRICRLAVSLQPEPEGEAAAVSDYSPAAR